MTAGPAPLLALIDGLLQEPSYHVTRAVRTEWVRNGLGEWQAALQDQGRLVVMPNRFAGARARHLALRRTQGAQAPGLSDAGLLIAAEHSGLPLITDDAALYRAGLASKAACLDLFDVCLAAVAAGMMTLDGLDACFGYLGSASPHYHPMGWAALSQGGRRWPGDRAVLVAQRRSPEALLALLR